jgi:hypothetical protein
MSIFKGIFASVVVLGLASLTLAQGTVVTKNADGTYSVIEYPVGKEVTVNLRPSGTITGKGIARVIRSADGTKVHFDLNGVPSTVTNYYAYAVDPSGTPTLLGPLTFSNGVATADFTTPMDQFELVLSPEEGLTGVNTSNVVFMSDVPAGYTVVQRRVSTTPMTAVEASTITRYDVPLLNVSSFGENAKTVKLHFDGADYKGFEAKAHIHHHKDSTTVRIAFDDLKNVPTGTRFILWASAPDGTYTKLGHIYNTGKHDEMTIDAKTSLTDFGLFLTAEQTDVMAPTGRVYSVFQVVP